MGKFTKACVASFIRGLTELYPAKFMRMHESGFEGGKPADIWVKAIGGYPQIIAERVLAKILDGGTKYSSNCPTIPEIRQLFNAEIQSHEHEKREAQQITRQIESDRMTSSKQKFVQGIPQGFGKYQSSITEKFQVLGDDLLLEAESIRKNQGGHAYAKFMFQAMGNEKFGNMIGKTIGSNFT